MYNILIANRLEKSILNSKITKDQLCSKAHIGRPTLDAILNGGDTKISTLEKIAKVLNIRMSYLFDDGTDTPAAAGSCVEQTDIDQIERLKEQITFLTQRIEDKDATIAEKERFISHLLSDKK